MKIECSWFRMLSTPSALLRALATTILSLLMTGVVLGHPCTIGLYRPSGSAFILSNSNTAAQADVVVPFGGTGDLPVVGDWDGNGSWTIGLYRPSNNTFYLRNSNTYGNADLTIPFGAPGDIPVVGDWDGNGTTTIGVYRPSIGTFYLRNTNSIGPVDVTISYGSSGDIPVIGDWDGNGTATIGVYRPSDSFFYLRNSNTGGPADVSVALGGTGDIPKVGDWDGNGTVTIGVYRPSDTTFYLRNSNTYGAPDLITPFGASGDQPLSGGWCNVYPSGDVTGLTDSNNVSDVLDASHCATLIAGTFYINRPVALSGNNPSLIGAGRVVTTVIPAYSCGQQSDFVVGGVYQPVVQARHSPSTTISDFTLDLKNLRKSCGNEGNYAILVGAAQNPSPGSRVTNLRIVGSPFGTPGYTTGWADGGGLQILNSENCVVSNNLIEDVGYTAPPGGSPGFHGIDIRNSHQALVQNNSLTHVSFGINVGNGSPQAGYHGDSSSSTISGNTIVGPASVGCPDCSSGRAMKLEACETDGLPLKYLVYTNNTATDWGGSNQGDIVPSGLHLECGVQYSTFTGNSFVGDSHASRGLVIRSSFNGTPPKVATHHNVFNFNTFFAGNCTNCFDVILESDGPDQGSGTLSGTPSIGRGIAGTNTLGEIEPSTSGPCAQFAHAWWDYPSGQNFVNRGQSITVAAAGIRPAIGFPIVFVFKDQNGNAVLAQAYGGGNGNCVFNAQSIQISSGVFSPGLYKVYATYYDGNSTIQIIDDWIGTLGQQVVLDVR